jgi:hypothetical protein
MKEATDFLKELLAKGAVAAKEAEEAAETNGISLRTLKRARQQLGVKSSKGGYQGAWTWTI